MKSGDFRGISAAKAHPTNAARVTIIFARMLNFEYTRPLRRSLSALSRHYYQTLRIQAVARAFEVPIQLHVPKTARQQTVFELAAGVYGVLEPEASAAAILHQNPFVFQAVPILAKLRTLKEQRAIGILGHQRVFPISRQPLLADDVDYEHPAIPETF